MHMETCYGIPDIDRVSRTCFYVGLGFGILGLLAVAAIRILGIDLTEIFPHCLVHSLTGYYCPGCGGTRSVVSIMKGKFWLSFLYHPGVLYFFVYYVLYEGSHIADVLTHGRIRGFRFCPLCFYTGAALIVIQWLVKVFLVYQYGYTLDIWDSYLF